MTSFKNLFARMSKAKMRNIYLLVLIQLVSSLLITIWSLITSSGFRGDAGLLSWFIIVMTLMPFIDIAYVFISTWQNEKEFDSQTWRLIPISSTKFYIANISSAIVNGLYLVVLQLAMGIVAFLPAVFDHNIRFNVWQISNAVGKEVSGGNYWAKFFEAFPIGILLSEFIAFLLFAFLIYSIVATIDLSSKTILDFLPERHSKIFRAIIIIVLVFVLLIASGNVMNMLYQMDPAHVMTGEIRSYSSVWFTNFYLLIFSLIFSGINIWLLAKYHESK
ncbi:ABC transporter permease [uncultured Lactobacillus sp.]|uniref:ABC transporter permease n=1 Tax=uncultured Lactobacillus sp. TaxID=153152 RepID=UPI002607EC9F|nr:ABC transporter permease [uncultured Lactobacillus sp.]